MAAERRSLPVGMTPRLLSREAAAEYVGVVGGTFDKHVVGHVKPVEIGTRKLWDRKALDRWLDERSGLVEALRPIEEYLDGLGNDRARPRRQ